MDKRYQFFISSTFTDLKEERQAVLKAVLELNHMPAGMELFPASDNSAWQLIRDVIDASDYYVLIVGGRYGSTDDEGLGYTEKEYDYAVKMNKPVTALLHEKPGTLAREKTETDAAAWKRLEAFRAKVERKHTCVYWTTSDDLKSKAFVSLNAALKRHPTVGWVRADQVPSGSTLADVLALRNRVAELEAEAEASALVPPPGTEDLQQGDDDFAVPVNFEARKHGEIERLTYTGEFSLTWNLVFAAVAPTMISEASEYELRRAFKEFLSRRAELSSRTFWTFAREFSPFKAARASVTQRV